MITHKNVDDNAVITKHKSIVVDTRMQQKLRFETGRMTNAFEAHIVGPTMLNGSGTPKNDTQLQLM